MRYGRKRFQTVHILNDGDNEEVQVAVQRLRDYVCGPPAPRCRRLGPGMVPTVGMQRPAIDPSGDSMLKKAIAAAMSTPQTKAEHLKQPERFDR